MSDIYKPESLEDLWKQAFTPIQNAYNSGYILGVEWGGRIVVARIIKLLEAERQKHVPWCGQKDCLMCEQTIGIERAIALIEGETES